MRITNQETPSTPAAADNIDAILRLEKQDEEDLALHHRVFHSIGSFVGTTHFFVIQCLAVGFWITFNGNALSWAIDDYPFPLLGTFLALEAVLLTSCVLIRQNAIDRTLERRDHLELQINLLAERESTRSLEILQRIAKRLDIGDARGCKEDELTHETSVEQIARDLRAREDSK